MKSLMKPLLLAKSAFAAAIGLTGLATPTLSHATPTQGVTCGVDTEVLYSNGVLKCRTAIVTTFPSMCPPGTTLNPTGQDKCELKIGPTVTSVPSSPGAGATGAERVTNPTQPDIFRITNHVYWYPQGAVYFGNAANGVKCPAGFSPVSINGGRGLRCEDTIVKKAVCDIGWAIERRDGKDRCTLGPVVGEYTIPENAGYIGAFGNPETHGWNLDTDRAGHGSTDYWVRETKEYRYPGAI